MNPVRPTSPAGVVAAVAELIEARSGWLRVAIDAADAAEPGALAELVREHLPQRAVLHVRASSFWRQAALRLENGRQNPDSWLDGWLDESALRREVLEPEDRRVLPALRDPVTDRALRTEPVHLPPDGVVLVSGAVLLGRGLPFDLTVHLHLSTAALVRRSAPADTWTLPALARYESERRPDETADLVVRADDPQHPALVYNIDGL